MEEGVSARPGDFAVKIIKLNKCVILTIMLGYRHAFHAGNYADVFKHFVLSEVLYHCVQKDKALRVIDTHAGAGLYALSGGYASKNFEFENGINRLLKVSKALPVAVARYVEHILQGVHQLRLSAGTQDVRSLEESTLALPPNLTHYLGSPLLAATYLRPQDQMYLFELHPTDHKKLVKQFATHARVKVSCSDGFKGLQSTLPPPSRRAVILMDPSFEMLTDYAAVEHALQESLKRFATGVYLIWYPCLALRESQQLADRLKPLSAHWLNARLTVHTHLRAGLYGCGMFVVNPPWTLPSTLDSCLPVLCELLAQDETASTTLECSV